MAFFCLMSYSYLGPIIIHRVISIMICKYMQFSVVATTADVKTLIGRGCDIFALRFFQLSRMIEMILLLPPCMSLLSLLGKLWTKNDDIPQSSPTILNVLIPVFPFVFLAYYQVNVGSLSVCMNVSPSRIWKLYWCVNIVCRSRDLFSPWSSGS